MTSSPLRVAIWCAVSSKPQAGENKTSLHDQETAGRQFAASLNATVVQVYTVAHTRDLILWSDAEATMPAYRQLRHDAENHTFDVLWALDIDRLGREPALQQQLIAIVERHGNAEVYLSTNPHIIGQKTTGHRYIESLQGVRAAEDQQLRIIRHDRGMAARVLKRGYLANNPPMGFLVERDPATGTITRYIPNPDLHPAIDLITSLYLAGHSYAEIRRRLNASPYPAPNTPAWTYSTIRNILQNDTYAGLPSYSGQRPDEPSPLITPIWNADTYNAILQERQRRTHAPYTRRGAGSLTGIAKCIRCKGPMIRYKQAGHQYLRCSTRAHASVTGKTCHKNSMPEHRALTALISHIQQYTNPTQLDRALQTIGSPSATPQLQTEITAARSLLADLHQQRHRLALALAAGKMDPDLYHQTDQPIKQRIQQQTQHLATLERTLEAQPDLAAVRATLLSLATTLPALLTEAPPAEIAALLSTANITLYCESGQVINITP